jgi:hypothetical protein
MWTRSWSGVWETDASVVERHARMAQVREQDTQLSDRRASNEMARIAAFNARERYIDVLRATVRRYKKNVAELGELAGVSPRPSCRTWTTTTPCWPRPACR